MCKDNSRFCFQGISGCLAKSRASGVVLIPGTLGVVVNIYALLFEGRETQPVYFLLGAILMMCTALLDKQRFYIALEVVVLSGCVLGLAQLAIVTKSIVLGFVTIPVLFFTQRWGIVRSRVDYFGVAGLLLLAFSYASISYPVMLLSAVLLSLHSWLDWRAGSRVAILWLVLNGTFALAALRAWCL